MEISDTNLYSILMQFLLSEMGQSFGVPILPSEVMIYMYAARCQNMAQMSPKVTCSIQYSEGMSKGGNIQGGVQDQNYLVKKVKIREKIAKGVAYHCIWQK